MSLIIYTDYKYHFIALFRADIIDYGNAFNLTKYLTNETDYIVWDRVASSIAYVRDMLSSNATLYPMFQVSELLALHVFSCQISKLHINFFNLK